MNAWRHYFSALEGTHCYAEMWLDIIFENEAQDGENYEGSGGKIGCTTQQKSEAFSLFTIHTNNFTLKGE